MTDMQIAGWVAVVVAVLSIATKFAADLPPLRLPRPHLPAGHGRHRREEVRRG